MKLIYLIQGEKTQNAFTDMALPDNVSRSISPYGNKPADEMRLVKFECAGNSIDTAKTLAELRENLPKDSCIHLIEDGPSLEFCTVLYPLLARYERGLRKAIALAMCSEEKNFSDRLVTGLSDSGLGELGNKLFFDAKFKHELANLINKKGTRLSKNELIDEIKRLDEKTVWNDIFSDASLEEIKDCYCRLNDIRNEVMHHRTISIAVYEEASRLLDSSINKLDQYAIHQMEDIEYVEKQADKALTAAKRLGSNYAAMLNGLDIFSHLDTSYYDSISNLIDTSVFNPAIEAASQSLAQSKALEAIKNTIAIPDGIANAYETPAVKQLMEELNLHEEYYAQLNEMIKSSMAKIPLPPYHQTTFNPLDNAIIPHEDPEDGTINLHEEDSDSKESDET